MQGTVDADSNVVLFGLFDDRGPARLLGQVEDVHHGVELNHVDVIFMALVDDLLPAGLEAVADEFQEDQRQDDVFVLG